MTAAEADTVDRAHLEALGARFGAGFVVQMIELFLAQGQERVDAAQSALAAGHPAEVTAAAHALKSSAGNLGARDLTLRAADVEGAGRSGAPAAELSILVGAMTQSFERARAVLGAVRDELAR